MTMKQRQEKYWDDSAEVYNDIVMGELESFKTAAWTSLIQEQLGHLADPHILDVGTGPGFFSILLSRMNHRVTAVDSSSHMIRQAQYNAEQAGADVTFMISDISRLPLTDNSYDVIISRNVTWTLPDPEAAYKEWYRLLRPEGKLIIFDANWNTHLVDPELRKEYIQDIQRARDLGYSVQLEDTLEHEGDEITLKLPLTSLYRPDWDLPVLEHVGYQNIQVKTGFDHEIHTESEKIRNRTTPMFAITAIKPFSLRGHVQY